MAAPNPPHAHTASTPAPAPQPPPEPQKREIRIVSHCGLFYWWPVWLVGFIMGIISLASGYRMVAVPAGTTALPEHASVKVEPKKKGDPTEVKVDVLHLPAEEPHLQRDPSHKEQPLQPYLHISQKKELGVIFVTVLLMVIAITNIPLRGLWSVIVIVLIVLVVLAFAFFDVWNTILGWISVLDIRITAGGYFAISITLFVLWLIVMLVFDRQIYIVFTPGQMRVRQEIGDAETTYDTAGITVQKQRSDLFRHWILGMGSGDLIVRTSGANAQEIQMPNVLFIGRKETEIAQLLAEKQVVAGRSQS
jgi:hypothetical protein